MTVSVHPPPAPAAESPLTWDTGRSTFVGARAQSAAARSASVERVVAAMRLRVDRPFPLEEMARLAFLSPFYFNRVFRQVTGVPPRRFHMALRMAAAKRLLLTTDLSVTDICRDLGYHSLGTFTTHFRELVGLSPRALRRLAADPPFTPRDLFEALESEPALTAVCPSPAITGEVVASEGAADDSLVFVGRFEDARPQGLPSACAVRPGTGRFRLAGRPHGSFHLAAAAFPCGDDPLTFLLPDDSELLVGVSGPAPGPALVEGAGHRLLLHAPTAIDPPILLALPLLLAAREDGDQRPRRRLRAISS